ncbi:unnamed protein product [Spirodela intermedia]|uniref:Uncharacterized protein n=1 Tax=Spirodela intermedia TaxID=51605 RepID=A0A7I8K760_SPIIN|nr:unnamed protein product [Spirodela intermedia]
MALKMRRPSSTSPWWLHASSAPRKVTRLGLAVSDDASSMEEKSLRASSEQPCTANAIIIEFQWVTCFISISSNTFLASHRFPHLAYMSRRALPMTPSALNPSCRRSL